MDVSAEPCRLRKGERTMKEIYTAPEMEIISFAAEDVITASLIDDPQTEPLG